MNLPLEKIVAGWVHFFGEGVVMRFASVDDFCALHSGQVDE